MIEQQTAFIFQNAVESNAKTMLCISDFGIIAFKVINILMHEIK